MTLAELAQFINSTASTVFGFPIATAQADYAPDGHGDFVTNLPFKLAGALGRSPKDIALALAEAMKHDEIDSASVGGNGYLNITMTDRYWCRQVEGLGAPLADSKSRGSNERVQVEFISANPTGPLTLANARGAFLGDVICNVLSATGRRVTREYYVNDAGGQVVKLVESAKAEVGMPINGERQYSGAYMADLVSAVNPASFDDDMKLADKLVAQLMNAIKQTCERMGITFDVWFSERNLVQNGDSDKMLSWLRDAQHIYDADGAVWLRSSAFGDDRDRVLIRSDGQPTYLLNDLAYHFNIFVGRNFDRSIKLWGADHAGQVASLKLTAALFAPKAALDFVLFQFVRLMVDGNEVKMSKRAGAYVAVEELLDNLSEAVGEEHAIGVARWFFLSRSVDTRFDFDMQLAKDESASNPYFYVMYAYARANSILERANIKQIAIAKKITKVSNKEIALIRYMTRFEGVVAQIATDYEAHRLTYYGMELAKLFQDYYESNRIIDLPADEAGEKLYIVSKFVDFMDRYWLLLGIVPRKRLEQPV